MIFLGRVTLPATDDSFHRLSKLENSAEAQHHRGCCYANGIFYKIDLTKSFPLDVAYIPSQDGNRFTLFKYCKEM